ncbi:MAG: ornithine cyclodeaminase [Bermanella sp.]
MRLITVNDIKAITQHIGIESFMLQAISAIQEDFARWPEFNKSPRHAIHYPQGVMELMPCSDDELYSFKFVNGHPGNTALGRLCVAAIGMLAEVKTGYPLMLSEMTLLTAIRTAATGALGAKYMARSDSTHLALIGTGAQAEFQFLATQAVLPIDKVSYFDPDTKAMHKFHRHMHHKADLQPSTSIAGAVKDADVIITATAAKTKNRLLEKDMIKPGTHILGMGGDCPGKTELSLDLLEHSKIMVEYLPQSQEEGEIQNYPNAKIHAELWELVSGAKKGRDNDTEITLFDSVGFAVEDFSILRLVHDLSERLNIGEKVQLTPEPVDPKDLYGTLL